MTFPKVRQLGTAILASAGVIGIVVGLAAQKTIGTFIAGLQIAFTQPIRLDDVVIVEGEWGRIEEITLTYVVVRIWICGASSFRLPTSLTNPFRTGLGSQRTFWVRCFCMSIIRSRSMRCEPTCSRFSTVPKRGDRKVCVLQVTNTSERTVELRALMSASDASLAWDLRCLVREKLVEFIRQNYPQALPRLRAELSPLPDLGTAPA